MVSTATPENCDLFEFCCPKTELNNWSLEIGEKFVLHPKVFAKFFNNCEGMSFPTL